MEQSLEPLFKIALSSPYYMTQCAPQRRLEEPMRNGFSVSCFRDEEINKLINEHNRYTEVYRRIPLNMPFEQKRQLLLRQTNCDSDACLVDNSKITTESLKPKGHLKWLSNEDINKIMHQFELVIPSFKFYAAVACDYYEVYPKEFPKDVMKYDDIAWIFNTDRTFQSGKHWVALYINNQNRTVEYFDSVGKEPNKYVLNFITRYFGQYRYSWSNVKHQKENNECGIYSIYWVLARLRGDAVQTRITDKQMHYFRAAVFR